MWLKSKKICLLVQLSHELTKNLPYYCMRFRAGTAFWKFIQLAFLHLGKRGSKFGPYVEMVKKKSSFIILWVTSSFRPNLVFRSKLPPKRKLQSSMYSDSRTIKIYLFKENVEKNTHQFTLGKLVEWTEKFWLLLYSILYHMTF